MKIKIKNIKIEPKTGQFGNYRQFVFQDELTGTWVYANEKRGFTDHFNNGQEVNIDDSYIQKKQGRNGKPYLQVKWPRIDQQPAASGGNKEVLEKLDKILAILTDSHGEAPLPEGTPTGDAPPHEDEDAPF